jgi:GNAT superfamily N-acetyltransferase
VTIRPPRADELERLRAIERAAGQPFAGIGMPGIAADEPPSVEVLDVYRTRGAAWVVTAPGVGGGGPDGDRPVGYILVDVLDDPGPGGEAARSAHIEQVSVDPAWAGRRLGARLIEHVAGEARRQGLDGLTLTTFRDVAWNAPYYGRLGFRVLKDDELGMGLRRVRDDEAGHGLDPALRVCMWRPL